MNKCFKDFIGIKGLCENAEKHKYLLDDIGIGLQSASKTADAKFINGAELVNRKIKQAWQMVLRDLQDGKFKYRKIVCSKTFKGKEGGQISGGVISLSKRKSLYTAIQLMDVSINAVGAWSIVFSDGLTSETITGSGAGNIDVPLKFYGDTLQITVTGQVISNKVERECCEGCNFEIKGNELYGLSFTAIERCEYDAYFCIYADIIAPAVLYKTGALILKELYDSDRINDFKIMRKETLQIQMSYLDSDLNLFAYDNQVTTGDRATIKVKDGMYQKELERVKKLLPTPNDGFCVSCMKSKYQISIL